MRMRCVIPLQQAMLGTNPAVQEQAPTCTVQGVYVIISSIASAANIAEDAVVIARMHHSWAQTLTD